MPSEVLNTIREISSLFLTVTWSIHSVGNILCDEKGCYRESEDKDWRLKRLSKVHCRSDYRDSFSLRYGSSASRFVSRISGINRISD